MAYYSTPAQYIDIQYINKDLIPPGVYRHHLEWHWAFEVWAYEAGTKLEMRNRGWVPHFNIINAQNNLQYHVYMNDRKGYYQAVPVGMKPSGY